MRQGEAAHITAASPGGKRYGPNLTSDERKAAGNGIWLCETCAKIIDSSEDSYPVDLLLAWKQLAEIKAARDARSGRKMIEELLSLFDDVAVKSVEFEQRWRDTDPGMPYFQNTKLPPLELSLEGQQERIRRYREKLFEARKEQMNVLHKHTEERVAAYNHEIAPLLNNIVAQCERILGPNDSLVAELRANVEFERQLGNRMERDTPDIVERIKLALNLR
jgi:hypothetical protein